MAASDLLIQPSLTDASNSVAKEMALFEKAIAVTSGVGDYDDYVRNGINGFSFPIENSSLHIKKILLEAYNDPEKIKSMGKTLKKDVISKFDNSNAGRIIEMHQQLMI